MDWAFLIYFYAKMGVFEKAPNIKDIGDLNNSVVESQTHFVTYKADTSYSPLDKTSSLRPFINYMHFRVVDPCSGISQAHHREIALSPYFPHCPIPI